MAKRSRYSKRLRTEKERSVMNSQPQPEAQKNRDLQPQPETSLSLSDEELNEEILIGRQLAMLDALSMLRRKAARMRSRKNQP